MCPATAPAIGLAQLKLVPRINQDEGYFGSPKPYPPGSGWVGDLNCVLYPANSNTTQLALMLLCILSPPRSLVTESQSKAICIGN